MTSSQTVEYNNLSKSPTEYSVLTPTAEESFKHCVELNDAKLGNCNARNLAECCSSIFSSEDEFQSCKDLANAYCGKRDTPKSTTLSFKNFDESDENLLVTVFLRLLFFVAAAEKY